MSLILSGTDGLSDVDGSAATPAIRGTDANTGIFFPAADTIAFSEGGVEAMRIDSSGNVGIGTNSPGYTLDVVGSSRVYSSTAGLNTAKFGASRAGDYVFLDGLCSPLASNGYSIFGMRAYSSLASAGVQVGGSEWVHEGAGTDNKSYYTISTHSGTALAERMRIDSSGNLGIGTSSPLGKFEVRGGRSFFQANSEPYAVYVSYAAGTNGYFIGGTSTSALAFSEAGGTERMRIDSSGNLLVGTTTANNSSNTFLVNSAKNALVIANGATADSTVLLSCIKAGSTSSTSQRYIGFGYNSGANGNGGIAGNGDSQATFITLSDERLKENIEDLPSQLANVMALRPVEFDYKATGGHQIGFIAQEVQAVYPDLVAEGDDGYLTLAGFDKNTARLIKAIQEQQAIIQSLTTRLTALENK